MGYIYKITNNINGKVYIGQTTRTIKIRFNEHKDSAEKGYHYSLYCAMRKYGIENFSVEEIEQCSTEELDDREQYWISFYDSYHNGYNMTLGGSAVRKKPPLTEEQKQQILDLYVNINDSIKDISEKIDNSMSSVSQFLHENNIDVRKKPMYDYSELAKAYLEIQNVNEVGRKYHCTSSIVQRACRQNNINILPAEAVTSKINNREVYKINKASGEILQKFISLKEAADSVGGGDRSMNISAVCRGKQKTAYGYRWCYVDSFDEFSKDFIANGKKKKVAQINKDTKEQIQVFDSVADAAEFLSGKRENSYSTCIASCARGLTNTAYGYIWSYV